MVVCGGTYTSVWLKLTAPQREARIKNHFMQGFATGTGGCRRYDAVAVGLTERVVRTTVETQSWAYVLVGQR